MNPRDLVRISRQLASGVMGGSQGRPRQTELCRAVSAAYYALFHALALSGANALVGSSRGSRGQEIWRRVYRALEHGHARNQCNNQAVMRAFPPEIRGFGQVFTDMQRHRHEADYDPAAKFSREEVMQLIDETEDAIAGFANALSVDRRAFAIHVLLRHRGD